MVDGVNGVHGTNVPYLVVELINQDFVYVTALLQNLAVMIVRLMVQLTQNLKDVTRIHVQVSQVTLHLNELAA